MDIIIKKMIEKLKDIRLVLNYKKEGVTQILPILYLKNDKEKALLFGAWKYNVAFVKGKNSTVLDDSIETLNAIADDCKKSFFGRMSDKDKIVFTIVAVGAVAIAGLVFYKLYKSKRR